MKTLLPKSLLLSTLLLLGSGCLRASHIIGGYFSYRQLSGGVYEVKLHLYRDCNSVTAFDGEPNSGVGKIAIGLFESAADSLVFMLDTPVLSINTVLPSADSSCLSYVTHVCVEEGVYTDTITLPSLTKGYTLVYQRCCFSATIINVSQSADYGISFAIDIPPAVTMPNNSPVFDSLPPVFNFVNLPLHYRCSATDADGDSLVYSLCDLNSGGAAPNPAPVTPTPPPYTTVPWQSPYSVNDMIGGTPTLTIDPATGVITALPNTIGAFVAGVCVREYRNGVLLDTIVRPLTFNITQCDNPAAVERTSALPAFSLSPNPSAGAVTLTLPDAATQNYRGQILDIAGQVVKRFALSGENTLLYVNDLPEGVFFVRLLHATGTSAIKQLAVVR